MKTESKREEVKTDVAEEREGGRNRENVKKKKRRSERVNMP